MLAVKTTAPKGTNKELLGGLESIDTTTAGAWKIYIASYCCAQSSSNVTLWRFISSGKTLMESTEEIEIEAWASFITPILYTPLHQPITWWRGILYSVSLLMSGKPSMETTVRKEGPATYSLLYTITHPIPNILSMASSLSLLRSYLSLELTCEPMITIPGLQYPRVELTALTTII
ncbi:MAG: hypothetical protein L7H04_07595 [Vulcanisaeta sp.]|nr:hypothetical protein [Vulcanisaeta sp.]